MPLKPPSGTLQSAGHALLAMGGEKTHPAGKSTSSHAFEGPSEPWGGSGCKTAAAVPNTGALVPPTSTMADLLFSASVRFALKPCLCTRPSRYVTVRKEIASM